MNNTRWGKSSLSSGVVIVGLVLLGCDAANEPMDERANVFGVVLEGLGTDLVGCTNAGSALSGTTLTLSLGAGEDAVVSVVNGKLRVNGYQCLEDTASHIELTSTSVTRLVINTASSGANSILIDLLPGSFGNIFGPSGGISIDASAGAALAFGVRGSDGADNFKLAQASSGSDLFMELSGNSAADVKILGAPRSIVVALGAGADKLNAQDVSTLSFLGTSVPTRGLLSKAVTVYGGAGNDTLEGGNGDDILDGGDGDDRFETLAAGGDGADVFQGGAGIDTVDYSNRSAGVTVDIDAGHTRAFVEGASLQDKALTAGVALTLTVGSSGTITYTSSGRTGIAAILAELNADPSFSAVALASADDRGRLLIESTLDNASISILSDDQRLIGGSAPSTPTRTQTPADLRDADDGTTGADEHDDVKSDIENIKGGSGNDVLTGNAEPNIIDGNAGNDDISGGRGGNCNGDLDTLNGNDGDDTFQMGAAANCKDNVDGGAGSDTANYELRAAALTISLDGIANDGNAEADNLRPGIEIVLGGAGNDTITGGAGDDALHGGPGNDVIKGGAGNDLLVGDTGSDNLAGEAGDDFFDEASATDSHYASPLSSFGGQDVIHGGAGINTCDYRRGGVAAATYTLCFSASAANCSPAQNDGLDADDLTNCNHVILDGGVDTVTGSDADDIIEGGAGDDVINGGAGNDSIFGDAGNDDLSGGLGDDTLDGGADQVIVSSGGPGDDVCVSLNAASTSCEL
jgi:Ca2+-binding RTX toxin-like protein